MIVDAARDSFNQIPGAEPRAPLPEPGAPAPSPVSVPAGAHPLAALLAPAASVSPSAAAPGPRAASVPIPSPTDAPPTLPAPAAPLSEISQQLGASQAALEADRQAIAALHQAITPQPATQGPPDPTGEAFGQAFHAALDAMNTPEGRALLTTDPGPVAADASAIVHLLTDAPGVLVRPGTTQRMTLPEAQAWRLVNAWIVLSQRLQGRSRPQAIESIQRLLQNSLSQAASVHGRKRPRWFRPNKSVAQPDDNDTDDQGDKGDQVEGMTDALLQLFTEIPKGSLRDDLQTVVDQFRAGRYGGEWNDAIARRLVHGVFEDLQRANPSWDRPQVVRATWALLNDPNRWARPSGSANTVSVPVPPSSAPVPTTASVEVPR